MDAEQLAGLLAGNLESFKERIEIAYISLSAFGIDSESYDSDPELVVIGAVPEAEISAAIAGSLEENGRGLVVRVYTRDDFLEKFISGNKTVRGMVNARKLYIIGDDGSLAGIYQS